MSPDQGPTCAVEPRISHTEIRERAYDLWDRNHRPTGYDLHFWIMAERELKAERLTALGREERSTPARSDVLPRSASSVTR